LRSLTPAALSLVGLIMLVVPAASGATATRLPVAAVARPITVATLGVHTTQPAGCTSDFSSAYFVGIKTQGDIAGGSASGVLGGASNQACDLDSAIGGGDLNIIGAKGDGSKAAYSFIGAGQSNGVSGADAFVGAGASGAASGNYAFVGAGDIDVATGEAAFVGAGNSNVAAGPASFIGSGSFNKAPGSGSFIGSGWRNTATGTYSVVGGGNLNTAGQEFAVVAGGDTNSANGDRAIAGGGNNNAASGDQSFVGGGAFNRAEGEGSFIGGGDHTYLLTCVGTNSCTAGNTVTGSDSFIGAGDQNNVGGNDGFIGGGRSNVVSGLYATIPGGANNTAAGTLSFAAGYHADAGHPGSFVWSDYAAGSTPVADSGSDQFVVRASGGTYIYSSENLKAGVRLAAGSGTWASLSDRAAKTDIAPLDDSAILAKIATLPVSTWRYKTETGVRHVGPMAQDFYAAFGVGEDDRHITSIDEDGVALAAIKALHRENVSLRSDNAALHVDNGNLHAENAGLRERLAALEKKVDDLATRR
jgi:hypothetical protein